MAEKARRKPIVLAMILCDEIIVEEGTRKNSLIGIYSAIHAGRFPAVHPRSCLYVALTDGRGDYEGCLRLVFAETDQEVLRVQGPIRLADPLMVAEIRFTLPPLPLPQEGKYNLDLLCDGERIGGRSFMAVSHSKEDKS